LLKQRGDEAMAVIGASPVTFISEDTTGNHGKQYQVPLSQLTIGSTGAIDPSTWPDYASLAAADQTLLTNLLKQLVAQGLLTKPSS
jgi:2-keto-3-deoxy-6-phosphogluconate aldolase